MFTVSHSRVAPPFPLVFYRIYPCLPKGRTKFPWYPTNPPCSKDPLVRTIFPCPPHVFFPMQEEAAANLIWTGLGTDPPPPCPGRPHFIHVFRFFHLGLTTTTDPGFLCFFTDLHRIIWRFSPGNSILTDSLETMVTMTSSRFGFPPEVSPFSVVPQLPCQSTPCFSFLIRT